MQTSSKELYHFWSLFSKLLKDEPPALRRKFEKLTLQEILKEEFFETPRMPNAYVDFIDVANGINNGKFTFDQWVYVIVQDFIRDGKVKKKNILNLNYLEKKFKLFTVNEINRQRDLINKLSEEAESDNPFTEFSDAKFDLYTVNEQQKNKLYELVKAGTLNFWFFINGLHTKKFKIDESKLADPAYSRFLRLMQIIKDNKTGKTQENLLCQ